MKVHMKRNLIQVRSLKLKTISLPKRSVPQAFQCKLLAVFLVFGVCKITVDEIVAMFYPSPIKRKTAYRQEAGVHAPNHWQTVGWHAITSRTVDWFIRVKIFVAKKCQILQTFWWV